MTERINMDQHTLRIAEGLKRQIAETRNANAGNQSSTDSSELIEYTVAPVVGSEVYHPRTYCLPVKKEMLSDALTLWAVSGINPRDEVLCEIANRIEPGSRLVCIETNFKAGTFDLYFEI